jgi:hypothetical protein
LAHILQTLVVYRLLDPGSEWRLHRLWFEQSAMPDLLGADYSLVEKNALYRCLDKLLPHKRALFHHLTGRWQDLFILYLPKALHPPAFAGAGYVIPVRCPLRHPAL